MISVSFRAHGRSAGWIEDGHFDTYEEAGERAKELAGIYKSDILVKDEGQVMQARYWNENDIDIKYF